MPNILLNNYCNRRCPYCFAQQRLKQPESQSQNLSLANLGRIIRFLKQSDIKGVSLLGGEPTLHPEFGLLVDKILAAGFGLSLFTNGLMPLKALDYLTQMDNQKLHMVVNINQPDDCKPAESEQLAHTLAKLGHRAGLGFNIYKPQPAFEFLLEAIDKYKLYKYIRLSMAQPILKADNDYLPLQEYSKLAPQLVKFASQCDKSDIKLAFDCGFILCMFSEEQLGRLYLYNVSLGFYCAPAIDIGPDLDLWRCFPLSKVYNRNLDEFENYRQIIDFYQQKFEPFSLFGGLPECSQCKYRRRRQCSGGCLSYKIKAFHL